MSSGPPIDEFSFHINLRDTDAAGVVFNAAPALWAEIGIENLLRSVGMPLEDVLSRDLHYPVVSVKIDHFQPARLGQRVSICTAVVSVGRRSVEMLSIVSDSRGELVCTVRRVLVAKSRSGQPVEAEPWLRNILCEEGALSERSRKEVV
jgi:YbgC/YbaW family acyl-CoA thioester hydrolase